MKNSIQFTVIICLIHLLSFGQEVLIATDLLWGPTGSHPEEYEMGGNPVNKENQEIAYIKSKSNMVKGFGAYATSMSIASKEILNTRIKLSCDIKLKDVNNHASVWMRVDGKDNLILGFDNLQTRPPSKVMDGWQHQYIILDIPDNSIRLVFGLMLEGKGELYAKNLVLEIVDDSRPTTNMLQ